MTDLRKAAEQALETLMDLRRSESDQVWLDRWNDTIDALRAALEPQTRTVEQIEKELAEARKARAAADRASLEAFHRVRALKAELDAAQEKERQR